MIDSREVNAVACVGSGPEGGQIVTADDGHAYLVRGFNLPQCYRMLAGELVFSLLLRELGIRSPELAPIAISEAILMGNPQVAGFAGHQKDLAATVQRHLRELAGIEIPETWAGTIGPHLGARYAPGGTKRLYHHVNFGHPALADVSNRGDLLGAFVVAAWTGSGLGLRVLFRPDEGGTSRLVEIIGQAAFLGGLWTLPTLPWFIRCAPQQCIPEFTPAVRDFEPWIEAVMGLQTETFEGLFNAVPPTWIEGEEAEFAALLRMLEQRRAMIRQSLADCLAWINGPARTQWIESRNIPGPEKLAAMAVTTPSALGFSLPEAEI